jgi:hypothetical protein
MAIARIQMPDGKIARFEVPDVESGNDGANATDSQISGFGKELSRQAGLTARYAIEGIASPFATVANLPAVASNELFGTELPEQNQALSDLLTRAGLPQPQNATERVVGDVSRALTGTATGGPLSKLAGAPKYVIDAFNAKQGTQAAATIGSAGAAGLTREAGGGAGAQLAAGIAGGVVPVGGYQVAARGLSDLYGAGKEAVKPFTTSGREQIVGGILAESADDAQRAAANLANVKEYIPNSPVTTAEAAGDAGLSGLQRGFRNQGANPFSDIESQQNAARQEALALIAGTPQELQGALRNREMVTSPLYEQAQTEFLAGKNFNTIIAKIDSAIESVGRNTQAGAELQRIRKSVVGSLPKTTSKKIGIDPVTGKPVMTEKTTNPLQGGLVQLYRELRDKSAKVAEMDGAYPSAVRGVVKPIVRELGNSLEGQSAPLKAANDKFRELSPEIEQMRLLQDIKQRASLTASPDVRTGQEFLSQPKLSGLLRDTTGEISETLTPEQIKQLQNVRLDAERSASLNARNVRASGSDTAQNLNGGKVVKQFLSEHAVGKLPLGIGRLLQGMSEKQINELTIESLKDPQLARRLLVELKPETAKQSYSGAMAQRLTAQLLGTIRGVSATQNEKKVK